MNKYLTVGLCVLVFAVGVAGVLVGRNSVVPSSQTGGDFPGGIVPAQLFAASASGGSTGNGYAQPIGSLELVGANGLGIGGTNQYHGLTSYNSASGTPASVITLGPLGSTTSTATTSVALTDTVNLSIGAICSGSTATTTVYVSGCLLSVTDGATGTAIVAYSNMTGVALAVPTSTELRITFDQLPY